MKSKKRNIERREAWKMKKSRKGKINRSKLNVLSDSE